MSLDKESLDFMAPFVSWAKGLRLKGFTGTITKQKSAMSAHKCYTIMTNHGKKTKISAPVEVWIKVERVPNDGIEFEVINTFTRKRYLFYYERNDRFPYRCIDPESSNFQKEVHNYKSFSYNYDIIISSGSSYRPNPYDEESLAVESRSNGNVESSYKRLKSSETEENTEYKKIKKENRQLRQKIGTLKSLCRKTVAQSMLSEIMIESLSEKLKHPDKSFKLSNYTLEKPLSMFGHSCQYIVKNRTNLKHYVLKESLIVRCDPRRRTKESRTSKEFEFLRQLKKSTFHSKNLLSVLDLSVETSQFKSSYYVLSENASSCLGDLFPFQYNGIRTHKDKRNLWLAVSAQVLSGLSSLKDIYGTIHGNLNFQNILIGSDGLVKLSCFEYSFKVGTEVEPSALLTDSDSDDFLYKHVSVLEKVSTGHQTLNINTNIDLWALGCIVYRLQHGKHLFQNSDTVKSNMSIYERKVRNEIIELVSDFMVIDYGKEPAKEPSTLILELPEFGRFSEFNLLPYFG